MTDGRRGLFARLLLVLVCFSLLDGVTAGLLHGHCCRDASIFHVEAGDEAPRTFGPEWSDESPAPLDDERCDHCQSSTPLRPAPAEPSFDGSAQDALAVAAHRPSLARPLTEDRRVLRVSAGESPPPGSSYRPGFVVFLI